MGRAGLLALCLLVGLAAAANAQWQPGGTIVTGVRSYHFAMCPDGAGGAFFAGWNSASSDPDIQAQRLMADGTRHPSWPMGGRVVCAAPQMQVDPVLAPDGAGGMLIAWIDHRDSTVTYPSVYVQRLTGTGARAAGWPAAGLLVWEGVYESVGHAIVADGAGGAIVLWITNNIPINRVHALHVRANGTFDPTWPGVADLHVGGSSRLRAISDGAGGAIAVWDEDAEGDIFAQRVGAAGNIPLGWPVNGRAVCTAGGVQEWHSMIDAGAQSIVITWMDRRNGGYDVYAHKVNFDGSLAASWPVDGLRLTDVPSDEFTPQIATDGAGGAHVVWSDRRSGEFDVYGSHALGIGTLDPGWPVNGQPICTAPTFQYPVIAPDRDGGSYVVWKDHVNGTYFDLYGTHIGTNGQPIAGWPAGGAQIAAIMNQTDQLPAIAADGYGAALVAWEGFNDGIHALKLGRAGVLDVESVAADDHVLKLSALGPNPMRSELTFRVEEAGGSHARLDVYDVAGRRMVGRDLEGLGPGARVVSLQLPERAHPGLYLVRLSDGERAVTARVCVTR